MSQLPPRGVLNQRERSAAENLAAQQGKDDSLNWIELPVTLPERYRNWVEQNCNPEEVERIPPPHITLLYGFDPARYAEVEADVKAAGDLTDDWTFDEAPRPGNFTRNVWLLPVKSAKITALFWKLNAKYPNDTYLRDGTTFDPHVTLCYMKHNIERKP